MVDPISAFGMATAAFNAIKKGFEVGRSVETMYGDIGRWMSSCEKINTEVKSAKAKGMSVEEEALEIFAHQKKVKAMDAEAVARSCIITLQENVVRYRYRTRKYTSLYYLLYFLTY